MSISLSYCKIDDLVKSLAPLMGLRALKNGGKIRIFSSSWYHLMLTTSRIFFPEKFFFERSRRRRVSNNIFRPVLFLHSEPACASSLYLFNAMRYFENLISFLDDQDPSLSFSRSDVLWRVLPLEDYLNFPPNSIKCFPSHLSLLTAAEIHFRADWRNASIWWHFIVFLRLWPRQQKIFNNYV